MARLLVVDDSRLTRRLIVGALKKAGHEVREAGDGSEGLEAFQAERPDFIFSDLLMPVMDGFEFATAIRELDKTIPLVIITADIQESSRGKCEAIGVTEILNKPLKANEICAAVDRALSPEEVAVQ